VIIAGKRKYLEFSDGQYYLNTADEDIQIGIESHPFYGSKIIPCGNYPKTVKGEAKKVEVIVPNKSIEPTVEVEKTIVEFPEVKTIQEAKDVLRSEPYNVAFQRLNNPESIAKVAEELGIKFPNL
jgi:tetraacyldisaccharide-1-P 4'-kinase